MVFISAKSRRRVISSLLLGVKTCEALTIGSQLKASVQMLHLPTVPACLLVSFSLMTCYWCCMAGETNKAGPVYAFCGDDFKSAWESCCGGRCRKGKRMAGLTMSFEKARSFLKSPSDPKSRKRSMQNGVEECCYEKCSFEEISEYRC